MIARNLVAALLVAVVAAQSTFDYQDMDAPTFRIIAGTEETPMTPKICFDGAETTLPDFTYGTGEVVSLSGSDAPSNGDIGAQTTTPAQPAVHCGNDAGRTMLFKDRAWAITRSGDGHCLSFMVNGTYNAFSPSGQTYKPSTNNPYNQNFRYVITRSIWACRYDSQPTLLGSTFDVTTSNSDFSQKQIDAKKLELRNGQSEPKIAYKAEKWTVYESKWNAAFIAAKTMHVGTDSADYWANPRNQNAGRGTQTEPFLEECEAQSGLSCDPETRYTNSSSACFATPQENRDLNDNDSGDGSCLPARPTSGTDNNRITSLTTSTPANCFKIKVSNTQERRSCATSVQLLARSSGFTSTTYTPSNTGIQNDLGIWNDVFGAAWDTWSNTDMTTRVHGLVGHLFVAAAHHPSITRVGNSRTTGPEFSASKAFWLNNQKSLDVTFSNSNTDASQLGFVARSSNSQTNKLNLVTTLNAVTGNEIDANTLFSVGFDASKQTQMYQVNHEGAFGTDDLGSTNIGLKPSYHYWAYAVSTYEYRYQWFCQNIGSNDPNDKAGYPYRFSCDNKYAGDMGWTTTPGQAYNSDDNKYANQARQFATNGDSDARDGADSESYVDTVFNTMMQSSSLSMTSDPVFVGYLSSLTNAGYQIADAEFGVNGARSDDYLSADEQNYKNTIANENYGNGQLLIGAGVVTLAVLFSVAMCVAAGLHGKLSAK